ncbi:Down syndrome cell adhesion molecule-like protein 1 [Anneissia japonica]|uniref:Down syndrome cell adhesion molecule-like protein 1 n=1 Tax=Anneissia japonica TaxID=1529436 RepID=UPI00142570D3|nr:Down syndrome cell adhesion molecule-like protein 1 [Anneissia japonica]
MSELRTLALLLICFAVKPLTAQFNFQIEPTETVVVLGNPVIFNCQANDVQNRGSILIHWKKNNYPLSSSSRVFMYENGSLHFTSTERQDEGLYSCVATLQDSTRIIELIESVAANLYFAFLDPVFFHPQSVEAVDRQVEPVNFQCISGSSRPLATIYWEKDGVRFDGGISSQAGYGSANSLKTSATLQINAVQTIDGGRYRCVVENALLPSTTMRSTYADLIVQPNPGVPYISQPPSSRIVAVNTAETLPCRIVGDPAPTITWTKDGVTVAVFDDIEILPNGDLYFQTLQENNSGQYVCTGTSRLGSVSTDPIQLTVAVMHWSFVSSPVNVDTLVGSSATIICRPPYSVPPANITWYKDNIEYIPSQGVSIISPGDLHFTFVEVSDEGQYFCTASNSYLPRTVTSSSASFTVNVAASISLPPNMTEVILGNDLQLQCLVAGKPTPVVTWYKYDQLLSPGNRVTIGNSGQLLHIISITTVDEGTYTCRADNVYGSESTSAFVDVIAVLKNSGQLLHIISITTVDEGTYTCRADNVYGSESTSAFVDVIVAPQISVAPGNVTGSEFGSIIIPCEVTGDPKPDIMWLKDGLELTILPNDPHYQLTNQGLLISDLHVVDEGSYTCIAVNQAGSVQSPGQLIIEVAPIIVAPPANQTVNDGSFLYFQCEAEGNPPPNYEWRFNGRPIPSWATVSLNGDIVTIQFASIEQVGKYSCRAYNRQGQAEAHAYLTVETSPVVSTINDIEVVSGSEIRVSCYAAGFPAPLFSWLKNGHALLPSSKVRFPSSNSLFVSNAQNSDQGTYMCVASNGIGSDRDSFYISVVAKPGPPQIQVVVAVNHMSVNLTWVPTGDVTDSKQYTVQYKQIISALWVTYADNIVSTPGIQSYVVSGLIESQTYMFRVFAKNSISVSNPSTVATFMTPSVSGPSAPRNLQVRSGNSSAVALTWEIPSTRYAPIHKYEVNYYPSLTMTDQKVVEIAGGVEPTVEETITGLMAGTSYSFRVRASTVTAGLEQWGDYSIVTMFTTSPAPPAVSPSNIGLLSTSPTTIKLTWTEIPAMFLSEPLLGYNIEYSTSAITKTLRLSGVTTKATLTNLQHYTLYTIRIQGFSESGFGPYSSPMTVQTLPGAPSSAPTALTASATSQTSLQVSWNGVSEATGNGPLSGYIVHYQHLLDQVLFNITVRAPQTSTNISGLQAGNSYILQVSAYNQVGTRIVEGPRTESITATTMDGIPGPVRNVAATPGPTFLVIRWWSPEQNNGEILDYTLEYKRIKPTIANRQGSLNQQIVWANATSGVIVTNGLVYKLEGLLPNSTYRVSIKARTSAGLAEEAIVNDFTTGEIAVTAAPSGLPPSSTTPDSGINIPATDSAQEENTSPLSFPNKTSLIIFICCVVLAGVAFAMAAVVLLVWCKSLEDNNLKRKSASFLLPNEQLSGGGSSAASDHVAMTTQLSTSGISTITQGRTDVQFVEPFTPESKPVVATSPTPTTNGHQRHFQTMTPQPVSYTHLDVYKRQFIL